MIPLVEWLPEPGLKFHNFSSYFQIFCLFLTGWAYALAQLVEAVPHMPEDCGFDSVYHCVFHARHPSSRPGVNSASNRNEYQWYLLGNKGGRCVGLATSPHSCTDCLEILGTSTSWIPKGLSRDCFTFFHPDVQHVSVIGTYQQV
jgi:hypothetical protein